MILVSVTVDELEQVPRVIVHRNVAGLVVIVTVVFRVVSDAIVAAPLTTDQVAVSPDAAAFAAMVKELLLHFVCAGPALLIVDTLLVRVTVALTAVHPFLDTVHRNVAGDVVTVTLLTADEGVAIVAAPETTDQAPELPVGAGVAAITKTALLQLVWADPAEVDTGHCALREFQNGKRQKIIEADRNIRACRYMMVFLRGRLNISSVFGMVVITRHKPDSTHQTVQLAAHNGAYNRSTGQRPVTQRIMKIRIAVGATGESGRTGCYLSIRPEGRLISLKNLCFFRKMTRNMPRKFNVTKAADRI